jgi:hypothetical protein
VPRGHDSRERSDDFLEALQFFEALHVCLRNLKIGRSRISRGFLFVELLGRYNFLIDKLLPARERGAREISIGCGLRHIRSPLIQFLINLRRFDLREQLSRFDLSTDIDIPFANVTVCGGVYRGFLNSMRAAGQNKIRVVSRAL